MLHRLTPLLLLLTGATGLLYEVVLGRLLALHLGSSGSSQAITLATFLGGLAAGAFAVEGPLRKHVVALQRPLMGYAALEAFIGVWVLALPMVSTEAFALFADLAATLPPGGWAATAAKLALAAVLVLPLTGAMGATLPVLAAGVQRLDPDRGVQLVSRYYVLNAGGAALGAGLTGFVLIEQFGLVAPLAYGAVVNLAVAAVAYAAAHLTGPADSPAELAAPQRHEENPQQTLPRAPDGPPPWDLVGAAFATGFASLCAEVLWTRLAGLTLGSSVYAFAFMLTVAIGGISLGSALSAHAVRKHDPQWILALSQALAALACGVLVLRLDGLNIELAQIRLGIYQHPDNYATWLWRGNGYLALHLLPSAMALGASFPALLAAARARGAATDRATARILGANTLGNLCGAMGCGFVLMPLLGLAGALLLTFVIAIAVAAITLPRPWQGRQLALLMAIALGLGPVLVVASPDGFVLTRGLFRLRDKKPSEVEGFVDARRKSVQLVYRKDGKDATISVDRFPSGILNFRTNGKSDGGTGSDVVTQIMLGHLGVLHRPNATQALTVGLGTGMTAAALASHSKMAVHVVELSPAVVEIAPVFAAFNGKIWKHPRVHITIADAREVLRALPDGELDIVVSEPSNPWVVGVADLFTADSFGRIAKKLKPDGVLVQWLQHYEMSDSVLRSILCTLHGAFGHVMVYRMSSGDLALVASNADLPLDFTAAQASLDDPGVRAAFAQLKRDDLAQHLPQFAVGQLCGDKTLRALCQGFDAPLRELYPAVEYLAPRDFFAQTASARALAETLDTRRGADVTKLGDTDLPRWLAENPLDDARRAALHKYLVDLNHPFDTALAGATTAAGKVPKALKKVLENLPALDKVPPADQQRICTQLRKDAAWLLKSPHTLLGPAAPDPAAMAWAQRCGAAP